MKAVYKREVRGLFFNMTGYVFIGFILLMAGIYSRALNFNYGYSNFEYVLSNMSFIFILAIPILTMRIFSEEKHNRTDQLLYYLPVKIPSIVAGKYLAMLTVCAVPTGLMAFYPLILSQYGTVNFKSAYSALLGFFFLGAALIALGMFVSSLTESQIISCVVSLGSLLLAYLMNSLTGLLPSTALGSLFCYVLLFIAAALIIYFVTKNYLIPAVLSLLGTACTFLIYFLDASAMENSFPSLLNHLALFDKFYNSFIDGMLDLTAIVYYLTIILVFSFLTVQIVEKKRWS